MNTPLSQLFGPSPILALQKHSKLVCKTVDKLIPFFEAALAEDWTKAKRRQAKIVQYEKDADEIKRALRIQLSKRWKLFMAIEREDLLALLGIQDELANKAKDIAGIVLGRQLIFPSTIHKSLLKFVTRCTQVDDLAHETIMELDELLETGFGKKEISLLTKMIDGLDKAEDDTDELQIKLRAKLHAKENELPPIDVMFMYKIIELTGALADQAQAIGKQIEIMLAD